MTYFNIHTHSIPFYAQHAIISLPANTTFINPSIVYASIGIHPWQLTEENAKEQWNSLQNNLKDKRIIAIGEAGLDKLKGPSMELQTIIFQKEIELAESLELPMIIHCVRAHNELLQLKKKYNPKQPWIIHGYRGKPSVAQTYIKHGCWLSFGQQFQEESLCTTPIHRLFIETDDTDIPIQNIYQHIANIQRISQKELIESIHKNVQEVFFKS